MYWDAHAISGLPGFNHCLVCIYAQVIPPGPWLVLLTKTWADCLALILATMMTFSPSSTMTAVNFVCFKKTVWSRTTLQPG